MLSGSMNSTPGILAIALEAADPTLLEQWCAAGELPNFSRLMSNGCYRKLRSWTAISSGATWPSITTGVSPAKHGMGFYHRQLRTGTYRLVKKYADEIPCEFYWKQLSAAGRRVAVFDIPAVYPLEGFNGAQIIGWGAEGLNWPQCSVPQSLFPEIFRKFGHHPLEGWYQKDIEELDEWKDLRNKLIEGTRTRTSVAKWLLEQEPWDHFLVGYAEPHWVGHYFFHLLDETSPRYDAEVARVCGAAILDIYREIDRAIGELTRLRPDSIVLVFSNTGMGMNYSGYHLVPEILQRLGMAGDRGKRRSKRTPVLNRRWGAYAIKTMETIVSAKNIGRLRRHIPEKIWDKYTRIFLNLGNDWRNSRAFALPSDFTAAIRINLKGREPNGIVEPGAEYDRLCGELTREFLALVNPATGQTAVSEVVKLRDRFQGDHIDDLPDLIVQWKGTHPIDSLSSPRIGTVTGVLPDKRSGAHKTHGFLIASGNGIRKSAELPTADIVDIAPTILHLQGLPVPKHMDGRALADMIAGRTVTTVAS